MAQKGGVIPVTQEFERVRDVTNGGSKTMMSSCALALDYSPTGVWVDPSHGSAVHPLVSVPKGKSVK